MVVMRGLILVSVIWTDLVKTLPVEDKNMYETFLSGNSKLKSCSNFNVAVLKTDIFKGICSLPSPNIEDFSQSQDKIKESMKFNLSPLLCYSIFHNVYAVCHPDTKISVKAEPKSTKPSDQFCENIPPISLPETCTHWLEDPNHTSKDDCFLVNEVVAAVLNNKGFCENKCLVPDPGKDVAPSVNPLCEQLLATSKILAQMSPKGPDSDVKPGINSSSSDVDLSIPPGLTKQKEATESIVVKENVNEGAKQEGLQPKSGEEVIDSAMDVVKGDLRTKKPDIETTPIPPPKIKPKADIEPTTIKKAVDVPNTNKTKVVAEPSKSNIKANIEPTVTKAVDGPNNNKIKGVVEPPNSKPKVDIEPNIKKTVDGPNNNKTKVAKPSNSKPKVDTVTEPAIKKTVDGPNTNKTKVAEPPNSKPKVDTEPTIIKNVDGPNANKTNVAEAPNSKPKVAVEPSGRADPTVPSNDSLEKDLKPSNNASLKPYAKTNINSATTATPVEDVKISNKSSMTASSDLDVESSGSFTSAFEFDYSSESSSLSFNEDKEIEDSDVKENIKDKSKPIAEKEVAPKGEIDSKPLVSVEEETKADDANDKEDVAVEKPSKDVTESKIEPAMPNNEKEIVETKYENNMKTGPEIDEQSSFFGYFILLSIVAIIAYLVFHNKQKILALVLEGRRRQGNRRRSGGREYRKLDSNLEDTMDPGKETSLRQVIY